MNPIILPKAEYNDLCSITLERFEDLARDEKLVMTHCGHKFSDFELYVSMEKNPKCPNCRTALPNIDFAIVRLAKEAFKPKPQEKPVENKANPQPQGKKNEKEIEECRSLFKKKIKQIVGFKHHISISSKIGSNGQPKVTITFSHNSQFEKKILSKVKAHIHTKEAKRQINFTHDELQKLFGKKEGAHFYKVLTLK